MNGINAKQTASVVSVSFGSAIVFIVEKMTEVAPE
ncbi:hypothetical protein SOVF_173080 [Spinacia oleracea]|nr:hypothetical protein SOVF_173080 [Spinacia oleracea]